MSLMMGKGSLSTSLTQNRAVSEHESSFEHRLPTPLQSTGRRASTLRIDAKPCKVCRCSHALKVALAASPGQMLRCI